MVAVGHALQVPPETRHANQSEQCSHSSALSRSSAIARQELAGATGLAYAADVPPTTIGMIGAGAVATRHVKTLVTMDGVRVAAVAAPTKEHAAQLASLADANVYPSHQELLQHEHLDGLYICVPPFAHGAPELAAIDARLPFFVEKPVAIDLPTAETIAARLAEKPVSTCVGYHWRWLDTFDRARDLLSGNPARLVNCAWLGTVPPPAWWRRRNGSGGQTIEQTTHVLDLARALVGEVTEVHAFGAHARSPTTPASDIDDVSVASLRFAGGALGTVTSTFLLPRFQRAGIEVIGEGMWLCLSETELVVEAHGKRSVWQASDSRPLPDRDFIDAVRGGPNRIRVPWLEAYRTHRLACTLAQSAIERRPLSLEQ
jgi:myo-inositol 2-dehydrogenase/D-chiro-inositol 1-dehydrogenase